MSSVMVMRLCIMVLLRILKDVFQNMFALGNTLRVAHSRDRGHVIQLAGMKPRQLHDMNVIKDENRGTISRDK